MNCAETQDLIIAKLLVKGIKMQGYWKRAGCKGTGLVRIDRGIIDGYSIMKLLVSPHHELCCGCGRIDKNKN